jgi:predicted nuclease with TOPRIM domain
MAEGEVQGMHILKSRNEKLEAEKKTIKTDKDELLRENNAANVALKSCRKDLKDSAHRFNKKIEELEVKIEELTEFKIMKKKLET